MERNCVFLEEKVGGVYPMAEQDLSFIPVLYRISHAIVLFCFVFAPFNNGLPINKSASFSNLS